MTDDAAKILEALQHGFVSLDDEGRWLKARSEAMEALSRLERREARLREALSRVEQLCVDMQARPSIEVLQMIAEIANKALASLDEEER
jgi:hypothetical protein